MQAHITGKCRSTMHKRTNIQVSSAETADLSINLHGQAVAMGGPWELEANCWIEQGEKKQVIQLPHDIIMAIHAAVEYCKTQQTLVKPTTGITVR